MLEKERENCIARRSVWRACVCVCVCVVRLFAFPSFSRLKTPAGSGSSGSRPAVTPPGYPPVPSLERQVCLVVLVVGTRRGQRWSVCSLWGKCGWVARSCEVRGGSSSRLPRGGLALWLRLDKCLAECLPHPPVTFLGGGSSRYRVCPLRCRGQGFGSSQLWRRKVSSLAPLSSGGDSSSVWTGTAWVVECVLLGSFLRGE